eukprot:1758764-Pleurochrysis_carterae.AAC.1
MASGYAMEDDEASSEASDVWDEAASAALMTGSNSRTEANSHQRFQAASSFANVAAAAPCCTVAVSDCDIACRCFGGERRVIDDEESSPMRFAAAVRFASSS